MKIVLAHRHHGVHTDVKSTQIPGKLSLYCRYADDPVRGRVPHVSEGRLLSVMPSGFLLAPPREILLLVDDVGGGGSTAVGEPRYFRKWGKYFDAYSLTLKREARDVKK